MGEQLLDWRTHAACNGRTDIDWRHDNPTARAICATCPVTEPCLNDALQEPCPFAGVRGGTTHVEHTAKPAAPPQRRLARPAACGTDAGYRRHLVHQEPTCDPCRAAHALVVRKWAQAQTRRRRARRTDLQETAS